MIIFYFSLKFDHFIYHHKSSAYHLLNLADGAPVPLLATPLALPLHVKLLSSKSYWISPVLKCCMCHTSDVLFPDTETYNQSLISLLIVIMYCNCLKSTTTLLIISQHFRVPPAVAIKHITLKISF